MVSDSNSAVHKILWLENRQSATEANHVLDSDIVLLLGCLIGLGWSVWYLFGLRMEVTDTALQSGGKSVEVQICCSGSGYISRALIHTHELSINWFWRKVRIYDMKSNKPIHVYSQQWKCPSQTMFSREPTGTRGWCLPGSWSCMMNLKCQTYRWEFTFLNDIKREPRRQGVRQQCRVLLELLLYLFIIHYRLPITM